MLRPLRRKLSSGTSSSGTTMRCNQRRSVLDRFIRPTAGHDAAASVPQTLNAGDLKAARTPEACDVKHRAGDRISYVMHPSFHSPGAAGRYREFAPCRISESEPVDTFSADQCAPRVSSGSHGELSLREAFLHLNYRRWMTSRLVAETTAPSTAGPQGLQHRFEREAAEVRNWIIEQNSSLVTVVASRFLQPGVTLDELRSEATMILLRTIDRFDVRKGVLFSTYASAAINRHLQRWLGSQARSAPSHLPPTAAGGACASSCEPC